MPLDREHLHHAYLVVTTWEREFVVDWILTEIGVEAENNPDLHVSEGPLGIDEARVLSARVATRPFGERRIIVVDASDITTQAQNALLKTLEEPGEGNHFFLVLPQPDLLLPTLRSRLQRIAGEELVATVPHGPRAGNSSPAEFLKLSPAKRLDFAKKFKESEKPLGPFLDSLLSLLKSEGKMEEMKKVFELRRYADDQSSDARLILEHIALVI